MLIYEIAKSQQIIVQIVWGMHVLYTLHGVYIVCGVHYHQMVWASCKSLQWCYNERGGVSNHRSINCLLSRFFRRRSNKTPKLLVTGLCEGNSPVTGEFPAQKASNVENVSIWWRHHVFRASLHDCCSETTIPWTQHNDLLAKKTHFN